MSESHVVDPIEVFGILDRAGVFRSSDAGSVFFFFLVGYVEERPWWPIQSPNKGRKKERRKRKVTASCKLKLNHTKAKLKNYQKLDNRCQLLKVSLCVSAGCFAGNICTLIIIYRHFVGLAGW